VFEEFLDAKFRDFGWRSARKKSGHPLPQADKEKLKRADCEAWKRDYASRTVPPLSASACQRQWSGYAFTVV
jgi:hypothetical protein